MTTGSRTTCRPITTFLNRLLALTIDMQAVLFSAFEELLDQRIEGAIAAGVYDLGLETLRAESFRVTDARVIYTHPGSGAETQLLTIAEKRRNTPTSLADALDWLDDPEGAPSGQQPLGPGRRAGARHQPDAGRRHYRAPPAAAPPDGGQHRPGHG